MKTASQALSQLQKDSEEKKFKIRPFRLIGILIIILQAIVKLEKDIKNAPKKKK